MVEAPVRSRAQLFTQDSGKTSLGPPFWVLERRMFGPTCCALFHQRLHSAQSLVSAVGTRARASRELVEESWNAASGGGSWVKTRRRSFRRLIRNKTGAEPYLASRSSYPQNHDAALDYLLNTLRGAR